LTFHTPTDTPPPLSPLLADVLSPAPTLAGVRDAAEVCYNLALSYLTTRSRGLALGCRLGVSIDDLAFDAVLYVFEQDEGRQRFHRLDEVFAPDGPQDRSDEDCLLVLRHLISTHLEGEMVRRIVDAYPPIERIRRNLRNSVAATGLLNEARRGDELWVTVNGAADIERPLPIFPPVMLERLLLAQARRSSTVAALMPDLAQAMRGQTTYRSALPLNALAVSIQNAYLLAGRRNLAGCGCPGEEGVKEFERTVLKIVAEVETRLRRRPIERDGVTPALFKEYIRASADILKRTLCAEPGAEISYFEILRAHVGSLDRQAYYDDHRRHLEFVVDQARSRYFNGLKRR